MTDAEKPVERPMLVERRDNNQPGSQWVLHLDDMTIGRGEESDIQIPKRQISRQHVRIFTQGDDFFIEDLDSRNGTWVGGKQIRGTHALKDGSEIQLALVVRLQFVAPGATAPVPFKPPQSIGGRLRLERDSHRVYIGDDELDPPLSVSQYKLLELLYINSGSVCSRQAVVDTVWPDSGGDGVTEQAIDALVRRLRERLNELDPEHQYIVTMRGHGFILDNPTS
ncbi:MAG: FHA domain-containing protein [Chloroflexota bacterium]